MSGLWWDAESCSDWMMWKCHLWSRAGDMLRYAALMRYAPTPCWLFLIWVKLYGVCFPGIYVDCRQDHSESRQRLINQPSRLIIQAVEFSRWYHHIQPTNRFRLTTSHIEPIHASEKSSNTMCMLDITLKIRCHLPSGQHFKAWESGNPGNLWLSLQTLHFPAGGWLNIQLGWLFSKKQTDWQWNDACLFQTQTKWRKTGSWLDRCFFIVFCSPTLWFWNLLVI
jgi:hypothetical protein